MDDLRFTMTWGQEWAERHEQNHEANGGSRCRQRCIVAGARRGRRAELGQQLVEAMAISPLNFWLVKRLVPLHFDSPKANDFSW